MGDVKKEDDESRLIITTAKKLYGTIQELSGQLDNLSSRCLEVDDLFAPDLQAKRLAIKDCCETLFHLSPKAYGGVAREKLWRLALYDAVNKARKIQRDRKWTPMQLGLVKAHLQGGIGVLQLYILKLKELSDSSVDPVIVRLNSFDKWLESSFITDTEDSTIAHGDQKRSWVTDLAHLCIINIGDLYRYLKEIHSKANESDMILEADFYQTGAQSHYAQAFLLRPDSGLAFNQLGNLYCDIKGSLQSAYYLLYSVQSENAYEGAHSNLRQLLDRKIVQFARLPASVEPKPIDMLVNSVLSLMYYFLYEHTHLPNNERHCQEALANFNERLLKCDPEMDDKFMFHLSSICVMTVWRLQAKNSPHTSSAVAFSISIFCQLINHLTSILEQHAREKQITSHVALPSTSPLMSDVEQDQASDIASIKTSKMDREGEDEDETRMDNSFIVPKRRKRVRSKKRQEESDSDVSDFEETKYMCSDNEEFGNSDESDECWSEDEDGDYDESIPDDELGEVSQPDGSEYSFKMEGPTKAFDSSSSNNSNSDSSFSSRRKGNNQDTIKEPQVFPTNGRPGLLENAIQNKLVIEIEDLLKCQPRVEAVLVALLPFLRWIQTSSVIKDALAANAEKAFLEKLCSTLNLLLSQNWPGILDGISTHKLSEEWNILGKDSVSEKDVFKWELDEDRSMLGIPQFKEFVNQLQLKPLTVADALVIRMGRMVAFGSWMVSTDSFSVLYSQEEMKFVVPSPQTLKAYLLDTKLKRLEGRMKNFENNEVDKLSRAYKEMKLRSEEERFKKRRNRSGGKDDEPRRRGRRGRGGGRRREVEEDVFSPYTRGAIYAVVDLAAVLKRFHDVKRIAAHRKFIVVIPSSVWKTLDMLKDSEEDDCQDARVAFQWLEAAFGRDHSGVILHKEQQKQKINFPYPRDPMDVDAWEYYDMMEYCFYITTIHLKNERKSRSNKVIWGDVRDKCRVFFLTGHEELLNTKIPRNFDPVKIARNVGIYVDYVEPYPGIGRGRKWKSVAKSNG